jgi:hypothetical protein
MLKMAGIRLVKPVDLCYDILEESIPVMNKYEV